MRTRLVVLLLVLTSFVSSALQGSENVWSGLVIATNVTHPAPIPPEMHRMKSALERTFGYNQFEVIGQARKTLRSGEENWLASSKHFSLHVDSRGATRGGYQLKLDLYQDHQMLLETDATLSKRSPLVVK